MSDTRNPTAVKFLDMMREAVGAPRTELSVKAPVLTAELTADR